MTIDPRQPRDILALIVAVLPFLWLIRWAIREHRKNLTVVLGTVLIALTFSFGLLGSMPDVVMKTFITVIVFLGVGTLIFAVSSWFCKRSNWRLLFCLVSLEAVLMYLTGRFGQGPETGAFLIVAPLMLFNGLAILGVSLGQVRFALLRRREARAEL